MRALYEAAMLILPQGNKNRDTLGDSNHVIFGKPDDLVNINESSNPSDGDLSQGIFALLFANLVCMNSFC